MADRDIATDPHEDDRIERDGTTVNVDRVADGWVYFSRWRDGRLCLLTGLVRVPLEDWTRMVVAEREGAGASKAYETRANGTGVVRCFR